MSPFADLSFENTAKTQRIVVGFSIATILLSNLQIIVPEIDAFGLRFFVDQDGLVGFAKLGVTLTYTALVLLWLPMIPIQYTRFLRRRDEEWWKPMQASIDDFYDSLDPQRQEERDYQEFKEDHPDWDDELYAQKAQRSIKRRSIAKLYRPVKVLTAFVFRFAWPTGIAALAVFAPTSVARVSGFLAQL